MPATQVYPDQAGSRRKGSKTSRTRERMPSEPTRRSASAAWPVESWTRIRSPTCLQLRTSAPFVTQRPQSAYIWYQQGDNSVQQRNPGVPLAKVEPGLSCAKYRTKAWLTANKPEWPPTLVEYAGTYASNVPQGAIVVPPKGAGLDRSQCSVLLSKPGLGDAVPCFQ